MERLVERIQYILISSSGRIILTENSFKEINKYLEMYRKLDIELGLKHAILKKEKGTIEEVLREFKDDETDYLEIYSKMFKDQYTNV